ncbi:DUF294 nucleotidyltransferase-like domain-containing protein [Nitrincola alkalilacustris]|uniref:DUF294 nucleotidyltransferase-like domain-containing protein n=1 Tax=Nitrincola alkalilacustris TaxID=1571224 RepID=UPI00124D06BA|nr:DUF294 nucleotidyltransferase-like domain-containing protein [Nitrincola alkalilacustris]
MSVEHQEIFEHLRRYTPFNTLPDDTLAHVAQQVEVSYFKAGTQILTFGEEISDLYFIRSGAVELYRRNGDLFNRLSEGDIFGQLGLLIGKRVRFPAKALEDTLIYFIPEPVFTELFERHEQFADYVEVADKNRLRQAVSRRRDANELMTSPVSKMISREPVVLPNTATVWDAARIMTEESVSSLVIIGQDNRHPDHHHLSSAGVVDQQHMVGIITDRDLRTRVVAPGLPLDTPIAEIMSTDLITVNDTDYVFEAMLAMLRHNVHHLPVLRKRRPVGVIALSDIIRYESQNSLFVVGSIFRKHSVEELQSLSGEVRASFVRMVNEDANSRMIGSAMAVIGRSYKQRLLELAEEKLGPPPIPYCFLALGSMARDEQLIVTDQDNALILDDRYDPALHSAYFKQLATFVSDGLAPCGFTYCTGGIMATNTQWRQPLTVWKQYFTEWIDKPTPETLLHSSIFFDLDGVWGKTEWVEELRSLIAARAVISKRFLASMAINALNRTPPLGFFKDFVVEHDGKHNQWINLKRRGTAPLIDLIRVHALAVGSTSQNSFDRLDDVIEAAVLPLGRGPDLRDALEFISMVRIRHQALSIEEGKEPDNNIEPDKLSHFERRNLKDAFQVLSNAQKYLKFKYTRAG